MRKSVLTILLAVGLLSILFLETLKPPTVHTESKQEFNKPTDAGGYLQYRKASRADENGDIPMGGLVSAKKHIDIMQNSQRDAGLWEWGWLGPSNIGGRIRAILPDPNNSNVLWIGSAGGGIWKSTNGGSSWGAINDFMSTLAITSMVFDPSTTNIMYAATGEGFYNADALPGAGIFKSTDGGDTWDQLASTNNADFTYVNRLAAHPNPDSAGVLFAVTSDAPLQQGGTNAIWKTEDGGVTWDQKLATADFTLQVVYDQNNHNELMVGGKGFLFLSDDYGETWSDQATGAVDKLPFIDDRYEASFAPSNVSKLYVSIDRNGGEIWRSTDNGETWSLRYTGVDYLSAGWYANTIWVCPTNSERIIVGGLDLYRSTDGGTTVTKISDWHYYHNANDDSLSAHADHHIIVEAADWNNSTNPEVYFGNDGGIQKTNDVWNLNSYSGWENLANTSLGITQFFGGAASPDGSIIVGGTQDNDKLRYKKTGTWSGANNWYQASTGDGGYAAINFNNTDIIYGEYTYLKIKKSIDGGDTYFTSISGLTDAGNSWQSLFIAPFSMDPNDPSRLVAGGSNIYITTDNADNWTDISTDLGRKCSAIDIDHIDNQIIWAGYVDGYLAKSSFDGALYQWTRVDENGVGLPDRYITDIAVNPNNSSQVFVTFGGYNNDNVWFTTDGGNSWENRSGNAPNNLPALQVNTVRVHPINGNWVYIGTDLGVFASEDKGENWNVITNPNNGGSGNEGPVNTEVSELFWQGDEFLIAATHGRGMYRTSAPPYKIYVDSNAASGGEGSQARPFQTVAEAADAAGPGAFIYIEAGTYNESTIIEFLNKGFIISTNGNVIIQ
ncbi:MAG: hypothetical protein HQ521_17405 [Bacteroidetes bacterium]|nr:hypothetical protein [Bacteroidota bacterium]